MAPDEVVLSAGMDRATQDFVGADTQVVIRTGSEGLELWAEQRPAKLLFVVEWSAITELVTGTDGVIVELDSRELYFSPSSVVARGVLDGRFRRRMYELKHALEKRRAIHSCAG